jgi:elongator complex protein 3
MVLDSGSRDDSSMSQTVCEIIAALIAAHERGVDVNLNRLKCAIARKHGMARQPQLVDIIAAVPGEYKVSIQQCMFVMDSLRIYYCRS